MIVSMELYELTTVDLRASSLRNQLTSKHIAHRRNNMNSPYSTSSTSASSTSPSPIRKPAELMIDKNGTILDCDPTSETIFGYTHRELLAQNVSTLIPQLSEVELVQKDKTNPLLKYLCHCGHLFKSKRKDGEIFNSELGLVDLNQPRHRLKLFVIPQ
jgi:PAS domain S-box-containing protein